MADFGLGLRQELNTRLSPELVHKLMGRLKLANFMDLPEPSYRDMVKQIEQDPYFKKLCYAMSRDRKVISFRRFARGGLANNSSLFELKEEITPQAAGFDIETVVASNADSVRIIQRIGPDKFRRYFLFADDALTIPEIADCCGISVAETECVLDLVNSVLVHQEVSAPEVGPHTEAGPAAAPGYCRVASIEKQGDGFIVAFPQPAFARGRYVIDYDKLEYLKNNQVYAGEDMRHIRQLVKKLELINTRKSITYKILESIITIQSAYLESGNLRDLRPFIMKNLAAMFNVSLGMISRTIQGKSVGTPWGDHPVRFFFPSMKWGKREMVRSVIESEQQAHSDEEIRNIIQEKYGVTVSRRAVNVYRKSLQIDSSYTRKSQATA